MRKHGKYEAPASKKGSPLLQAYMLSLVSLVLCSAMFLGTTMAWFTSDVISSGNQIHIGTLQAELWHGDQQITSQNNEHILSAQKVWEPGASTEEPLKISNAGDIPFRYTLQLLANGWDTMTQEQQEQLMATAQWFEVSYQKKDDTEWTSVLDENNDPATLAQVLQQGIPVLQGELKAKENAEYKLRLYMKTEAPLSQLQEKTVRIDVRLVAFQLAQENPGVQEENAPDNQTE